MSFDLMRDEARLGPGIRRGLSEMCAVLPMHGEMYEIGSYAGESAEIMSAWFRLVNCVDPWESLTYLGVGHAKEVEDAFDETMRSLPNVRKFKETSKQAAVRVSDESLDFVYIDALHTFGAVVDDLSLWWPKVKPGGAIGGHDYLPDFSFEWTKVSRAVDFFFEGKLPMVFPDSSWVIVKEAKP